MHCSCTGIGGLEATLKLNYVLVLPMEQAAKLHEELLVRGVPERQIYEVDPNRKPRPHKSTVHGPTALTSGSGGGRSRGREKRFMPGSIRLGTYSAGGQQYNVGLRWGSVWISMADRPSGADGGGASEVTVADGGGASEVSPAAGGSGAAEVPPAVDRGVDAAAVPEEDGCTAINKRTESDDGRETDDANTTGLGGGCEDDNDDPNLARNDGRRCNSSSTLCEDCKRWLLHEYFGDRCHEEVTNLTGRHACIYRRIVDRLFVVTVTGGGGADDDDEEDEDDDGTAYCKTTAEDDGIVERPSTATDPTTTKAAVQTEGEQPCPTTPAQPAPPTGNATTPSVPDSPGKEDHVDEAAENAGKPKSKKKTFFGKFCKSKKKTKQNPEQPKTD